MNKSLIIFIFYFSLTSTVNAGIKHQLSRIFLPFGACLSPQKNPSSYRSIQSTIESEGKRELKHYKNTNSNMDDS